MELFDVTEQFLCLFPREPPTFDFVRHHRLKNGAHQDPKYASSGRNRYYEHVYVLHLKHLALLLNQRGRVDLQGLGQLLKHGQVQ